MENNVYLLIEHVRGRVSDITYMMAAQAKQLTGGNGKITGLLLGSQLTDLANDLAVDEIWYVDDPALKEFTSEAYTRVLEEILRENHPFATLFGDTTIGSEVAGLLSARLGIALISGCENLRIDNNCLTYRCQLHGGKMLAEGILPDGSLVLMIPGAFRVEQGITATPPTVKTLPPPALNDIRIDVKQYISPPAGDIDITQSPILIAVGRGIQREDNLEMVNELAEAIGGVVGATRPIVDLNWLPVSRLIGKSGRAVKPRVYLALGISGAPEHTEAITGSDLIIAINTDPAAPIFNLARYGAEVDILDFMPALTEKLQEIK